MYGNRNKGLKATTKIEFTIEAAQPSNEQRAIASVYDDYLPLMNQVGKKKTLKGLNIIKDIQIDDQNATPLLLANVNGEKYP